MRFRDRLALNLCPLIARIALAVSFAWFGFGKFKIIEYTGQDAQILINLGVAQSTQGAPRQGGATGAPKDEAMDDGDEGVPPNEGPANGEESGDGASGSSSLILPRDGSRFAQSGIRGRADLFAISLLGMQDETTTTQEDESADEQSTEESDPAAQEQETTEQSDTGQPDEETTVDESQEGGEEETTAAQPGQPTVSTDLKVEAYRFHTITVRLEKVGHPYPTMMARIAVVTETAGSILILIGLFTRIWGLGFVVMMCYAFYLTTWQSLVQAADPTGSGIMYIWQSLRAFGQLPPGGQVSAMNQLMHFALAWILVFGGAGALSLDNAIFRGRRSGAESEFD